MVDSPAPISVPEHARLTQQHVSKLAAAFGMSSTPQSLRGRLKERLQAAAGNDLQKAATVGNALDAAYAAIDELSKMGHQFSLVEGPAQAGEAPQEWPKMLYQDGGPAKVFDAPPTSEDGGPWFEHPTERGSPPSTVAGEKAPAKPGKKP